MRIDRYFRLCVEEASRGLWYNRRTVAPAVVIIAVSLIVLGAFLLVSENLNALLASWRERGQVQIFLAAEITDAEVQAIARELDGSPAVERYQFLSSDSAAELFRSDFAELGDLLTLLEENPLPPSYAVTITSAMRTERILETLTGAWGRLPGVDGIQYDLQIIRRLELGVRGVRLIGVLLGGTVLVAAVITTANVVRVLVVSRRREIDVMRLVGASEPVVRGRFLFEGALQGTLGGVIAMAVLFAVYSLGLSYLDRDSLGILATLPLQFLSSLVVLGLVAGGAFTGLLGSWLAFGPGSALRSGS